MGYPGAECREHCVAPRRRSDEVSRAHGDVLTSRVCFRSSKRHGTSAPSSSRLAPLTGLFRSELSGHSTSARPVRLTTRNGASVPRPSLTRSAASLLQTVMEVMASSMNADVRLSSSRSRADRRMLMGLLSGPAVVRLTWCVSKGKWNGHLL